MLRLVMKPALVAVMFAASASLQLLSCDQAWAGKNKNCPPCKDRQYGQPELFYNYYMPACNGFHAAMYPAPGQVPMFTGHTYYTYQPLMPHEFLYKHHRTYYRYYDGGRGLNRTSVHWYHPPLSNVGSFLHSLIEVPR